MMRKGKCLVAWSLTLAMCFGLPQGTLAAEFTGGDSVNFVSEEFTDESADAQESAEILEEIQTEPESGVEQEASENESEESEQEASENESEESEQEAAENAAEVLMETEELTAVEETASDAAALSEEASGNLEDAPAEDFIMEAAEEEECEVALPDEEAQGLTVNADEEADDEETVSYTLSGVPEKCSILETAEDLSNVKAAVCYSDGTTEEVTGWTLTYVYDSGMQSMVGVYKAMTEKDVELTLRFYDADGNMAGQIPYYAEDGSVKSVKTIAPGIYTIKLFADDEEVSGQEQEITVLEADSTPLTVGEETPSPYTFEESESILYTFSAEKGKTYIVRIANENASDEMVGGVYPTIWHEEENGALKKQQNFNTEAAFEEDMVVFADGYRNYLFTAEDTGKYALRLEYALGVSGEIVTVSGTVLIREQAVAQNYSLSGVPAECSIFDVYESLGEAKVIINYTDGTTEEVAFSSLSSEYDSETQSSISFKSGTSDECVKYSLRLYDAEEKAKTLPYRGGVEAGTYTVKLYADDAEISGLEQKMTVSGVETASLEQNTETPYSVDENESVAYTFTVEAEKGYLVKVTQTAGDGTSVYLEIWHKEENGTFTLEKLNQYGSVESEGRDSFTAEADGEYILRLVGKKGTASGNIYVRERVEAESYVLSGVPETSGMFSVYESLQNVKVTVSYADGNSEEVTCWNTGIAGSDVSAKTREGVTLRLFLGGTEWASAVGAESGFAPGSYTVKLYVDNLYLQYSGQAQSMTVTAGGIDVLAADSAGNYCITHGQKSVCQLPAETADWTLSASEENSDCYVCVKLWRLQDGKLNTVNEHYWGGDNKESWEISTDGSGEYYLMVYGEDETVAGTISLTKSSVVTPTEGLSPTPTPTETPVPTATPTPADPTPTTQTSTPTPVPTSTAEAAVTPTPTATPVLKLNASGTLPLKRNQKLTKLKVTDMAEGDSAVSWSSSNSKIVKVSGKADGTCKLTAGKKAGTATITVRLASGLEKTITIKVQKSKVTTKKLTGVPSKLSLKKGQSQKLSVEVSPISSTDKITYKSSNKKVVTINSKGVIKAKKKGKATITVKSGKKTKKIKVTVK